MSTRPTRSFNLAYAAILAIPKVIGERVTSDEHGLLLAAVDALRADCTRRQVAAVITDVHHRVVGTGYNGAPPGQPGCLTAGACPRGRMSKEEVAPGDSYSTGAGACIAIHAEANAIMFSDPLARRGGTMYLTDAPCDGCSRLIAGSGLARVLWPVPDGSGGFVIEELLVGPGHPVGGHY